MHLFAFFLLFLNSVTFMSQLCHSTKNNKPKTKNNIHTLNNIITHRPASAASKMRRNSTIASGSWDQMVAKISCKPSIILPPFQTLFLLVP